MSQVEQISKDWWYINILISGLCVHISGLFFSIKFFICFVQFLRLGSWYIRKISPLSLINVAYIFFCFFFFFKLFKISKSLFCCLWVLSHSSKCLPLTRIQRNLSMFSCLIYYIWTPVLFGVYSGICFEVWIQFYLYPNIQSVVSAHFFFIYLLLFWMHQVFVAAHGLSLVAAARGHSLLQHVGSARAACGRQNMGSTLVAHTLSSSRHVESSGQEIEPVSPPLAGRLLSTVAQGKSPVHFLKIFL